MAFKTLCYLLFLGNHSLYLSKQTMAFYTVFAKTLASWNVLSSSVPATGKLLFFLQEMTQDIISLKSLLNCALKVEIIFSSFAILESLYQSSSLWSFNSTCFCTFMPTQGEEPDLISFVSHAYWGDVKQKGHSISPLVKEWRSQ